LLRAQGSRLLWEIEIKLIKFAVLEDVISFNVTVLITTVFFFWQDTVYEYHVDTKQKAWALWEDKLRSGWRYTPKYVHDY